MGLRAKVFHIIYSRAPPRSTTVILVLYKTTSRLHKQHICKNIQEIVVSSYQFSTATAVCE